MSTITHTLDIVFRSDDPSTVLRNPASEKDPGKMYHWGFSVSTDGSKPQPSGHTLSCNMETGDNHQFYLTLGNLNTAQTGTGQNDKISNVWVAFTPKNGGKPAPFSSVTSLPIIIDISNPTTAPQPSSLSPGTALTADIWCIYSDSNNGGSTPWKIDTSGEWEFSVWIFLQRPNGIGRVYKVDPEMDVTEPTPVEG